MKTLTAKTALLVALSSFLVQLSYADAGMYITARGTKSFDQMWVFSNANCTRGFDNGWDGFKMIASTAPAQLYAAEVGGNFQVNAIPDFNNTYLCFKAGYDTEYTLTFFYQELDLFYQQLYLIDSVANKIVDIYAEGTEYTFTADNTTTPEKRFKIVTYNPNIVAIETTIETEPIEVIETVLVNETVTGVEPGVLVDPSDKGKNGNNDQEDLIKIHSNNKNIYVNNNANRKGELKVYDAKNGKLVKTNKLNPDGITDVATNLKTGTYVVNAITAYENVSRTIIIR